MNVYRAVFFTLCIACWALLANAQIVELPRSLDTKEQIELKAKALTLLTEVVNEAESLKLAENRVLVRGIAARLLWEKDPKQARALIESAAAEIVQARNSNKLRADSNPRQEYYWLIIENMLRGQILSQVRGKDSELALKICYATRAPELDQSVQLYQQILTQTGKAPDLSRFKEDERQRLESAKNEMRLEQEIQKEIAKNDVPKLAANIRQDIARQAESYLILSDIEQLNQKDHEQAQKLLTEYAQSVAATEPANNLNGYLAYQFVTRYAAPSDKPPTESAAQKNTALEIDRKIIKTIANKEFDRLLKGGENNNDFGFVERAIYLRKVLPERFPEIKARFDAVKARGTMREWADDAETTDRLGEKPTLADVIKNSKRMSSSSRTNYYKRAAARLLETESEEKIKQLLAQIPDEKERETTLDYLNSALSEKKAGQENLIEAKQSIAQIKSVPEKVARLTSLAALYHSKKTDESQKIAEDLMSEAERFVNINAETSTQMDALFPVIAAYAAIKPQKASEIIAPLIARSNELINAYVLLANYNDTNYPYVSENEIIFGAQDGYSSYKWRYGSIAKLLAASDFAAAKNLIESFERRDVQIIAKLSLVESILGQ